MDSTWNPPSWFYLPAAIDAKNYSEHHGIIQELVDPLVQSFRLLTENAATTAEHQRKSHTEASDSFGKQFVQFYNKLLSRATSSKPKGVETLPAVDVASTSVERLYDTLCRSSKDDDKDTSTTEQKASFEKFSNFIKFALASFKAFLKKKNENKALKIMTTKKELPASEFKQTMITKLQHNNVIVIAGDTGCGKSTQIPQYLLEEGFSPVICTQPRRVAAVSLARRVQLECDACAITGEQRGEEPFRVSYHVRFDKKRLWTTKDSVASEDLVYATEGILLRQLVSQRATKLPFQIVCLDEVHERHVSTDFLFTILRSAIRKPFCPFKLVLMSATADVDKLSNYFDGAPILQIPGRTHPVDIMYRPSPSEESILNSQSERVKRNQDKPVERDETAPPPKPGGELPNTTKKAQNCEEKQLHKSQDRALRRLQMEEDDDAMGSFSCDQKASEQESKQTDDVPEQTFQWIVEEPILFSDMIGDRKYLRKEHHHSFNDSTLDISVLMSAFEEADSLLSQQSEGDLLIFVSGVKEIQEVIDAANERIQSNEYTQETKGRAADSTSAMKINKKPLKNSWGLLPLHSGLSTEEQERVFTPPSQKFRKCVVATDVAETSVTIDGIRCVIDTGRHRMIAYQSQTHTMQLQEFWIPRSSAEQRTGRAGRTRSGYCLRLFSEDLFTSLPKFAPPEIQRIPVQNVMIQALATVRQNENVIRSTYKMTTEDECHYFTKATGLELIDPPSEDLILQAEKQLKLLDAVQEHANSSSSMQKLDLMPLGKILSVLPTDVQIGKAAILGCYLGVGSSILSIAAALSVDHLFTSSKGSSSKRWESTLRPLVDGEDVQEEAGNDRVMKEQIFIGRGFGDMFSSLGVFDAWSCVRYATSKGLSNRWERKTSVSRKFCSEIRHRFHSTRNWCKSVGVSYNRAIEMANAIKQLQQLLDAYGILSENCRVTEKPLKRGRNDKRYPAGRMKPSTSDQYYLPLDDEVLENFEQHQHQVTNIDDTIISSVCRHGVLSRSTIDVIKFSLLGGLYPNIAVPDPGNDRRAVSDALFHTRHRYSVRLHPSSHYFASLLGDDELPERGAGEVRFLMFDKLLETRYPYMTKVEDFTPIWLVLVAKDIKCSDTVNELLIDDWVLIRLASETLGGKLIAMALEIRALLELTENERVLSLISPSLTLGTQLEVLAEAVDDVRWLSTLNSTATGRLKSTDTYNEECEKLLPPIIRSLETNEVVSSARDKLPEVLSSFLGTSFMYTTRRVLDVEAKTLVADLQSQPVNRWLTLYSKAFNSLETAAVNEHSRKSHGDSSTLTDFPKQSSSAHDTHEEQLAPDDESSSTGSVSVKDEDESEHAQEKEENDPGDAYRVLTSNQKQLCPYCGIVLYVSDEKYLLHQKTCRGRR